jgi:DNA adenine methylase
MRRCLKRFCRSAAWSFSPGYPSPLYDEALSAWRRIERAALADGARERTEVLWI